MNKCFVFLIVLFFVSCQFVLAQDVIYEDELQGFRNTGVISEELLGRGGDLTELQRSLIMGEISNFDASKKEAFWNQWGEMDAKNRRVWWNDLDDSGRRVFLKSFEENYGVKMTGFDETFYWGSGQESSGFSTMGNLDLRIPGAEVLAKHNGNSNDKIVEFVYANKNGVTEMTMKRESGISRNFKISEDSDESVFYDFKNDRIMRRVKPKEGELAILGMGEGMFSGTLNGKGNVEIDLSGDKARISLDNKAMFMHDLNNGEIYGQLEVVESEDENGNSVLTQEKAELIFNEGGLPEELSNIRIHSGEFLGGEFEGNTRVFYSEDEYNLLSAEEKTELGGHLVVDIEGKRLIGDVKRYEGGFGKDFVDEYADSLSKGIEGLSDGVAEIQKNLGYGDKAEAGAEVLGAKVPLIGGWLKGGLLGIKESQTKTSLTKSLFGKDSSYKKLGSWQKVIVDKMSSPEGMKMIERGISFADKSLQVAEDWTLGLQKGIVDSELFADNPILRASVPDSENSMDIVLGSRLLEDLNGGTVDLRAGTLSVYGEDFLGNSLPVKLFEGTNSNYIFDPYVGQSVFEDFELTLENSNQPEQEIRLDIGDDGHLQIKGVGVGSLKEYGQENIGLVADVVFYGIVPNIYESQDLVSASLSGSEEVVSRTQRFIGDSERKYYKMDSEFRKNDGAIDKAELEELESHATASTIQAYLMMGEGDTSFRLEATSEKSEMEFNLKIEDIGLMIKSISGQEKKSGNEKPDISISPILKAKLLDSAYNDKDFQNEISQRGIGSADDLGEVLDEQTDAIANFLIRSDGALVEFNEDSKNKLYTLKRGSSLLQIDPLVGPIVSDFLPMVVGSVRNDVNGNIVIDNKIWDNRFQKGANNVVIPTEYRARGLNVLVYGVEKMDEIVRKDVEKQLIEGLEEEYEVYLKIQ